MDSAILDRHAAWVATLPTCRADSWVNAHSHWPSPPSPLWCAARRAIQRTRSYGNEALTLVHVDVQSAQGDSANLNVCYTYTHSWRVNLPDSHRARRFGSHR